MPKYLVSETVTIVRSLVVEAENEEMAQEYAYDYSDDDWEIDKEDTNMTDVIELKETDK